MHSRDLLQLALLLGLLLLVTPVLGRYMAFVFTGKRHSLLPLLGPIENLIYRVSGIDPKSEQTWRTYLGSLLVFNALGIVLLTTLQLSQGSLPGNPAALPNISFALAFNTAVSFVTNTNWQAYSGENTMSYTTQMLGLGVQNFTSAATGIAVVIALIRGISRRNAKTIGNFWTDLTRATLYVLLPLSILFAAVLTSQGVVQTFASYANATTLEGAEQTLPLGPAASQIAIKQLGTNGGGFFGVNAAHPYENPTPLTNFLQILTIFLIPAALTYTFGTMIGDQRQGWTLFAVMLSLFLAGLAAMWWAELQSNPAMGFTSAMEGKETRFGVFNSVLFATTTTAASCGAVNAMHDSFSPIGGLVQMVNMMLGEVIFGGVGAGLYGILLFVLLTVFIAGLMVGRTPEYLGKKIEATEIRWAVIAVLAPCATILLGSAATLLYPEALKTLNNAGPHGLSEVLYAYTSAAANNGSAFAGLGANTDWYNYTLAAAMLIGRFAIIAPALAIAGSLAAKKTAPPSAGTFPTYGATFGFLLTAVIVIVGALTFFPALSLGPVVEHLLMQAGHTF